MYQFVLEPIVALVGGHQNVFCFYLLLDGILTLFLHQSPRSLFLARHFRLLLSAQLQEILLSALLELVQDVLDLLSLPR